MKNRLPKAHRRNGLQSCCCYCFYQMVSCHYYYSPPQQMNVLHLPFSNLPQFRNQVSYKCVYWKTVAARKLGIFFIVKIMAVKITEFLRLILLLSRLNWNAKLNTAQIFIQNVFDEFFLYLPSFSFILV